MLSDSEIFNRLPISDQQKAELYKLLILSAGQRMEPQCPADSSKTPASQGDHPLVEKPGWDECLEDSRCARPEEKSC